MPNFPSVEWFKALADITNRDEAYRKLGTCDAEVGIDVDGRIFEVDFEAYEVINVAEINATRTRDLDFTLLLPFDQWKAMIENIKQNGQAEHEFTLNSLDLATADEFARAEDYYRRDKFYRFNQSLQRYFDASAAIDTQFLNPVGSA